MAPALMAAGENGEAGAREWAGTDVTLDEVGRALAHLREAASREGPPELRTRVLTHLAWVPEQWVGAAAETLAGLGPRHPSRTILLLPEPGAAESGIDADVSLLRFEVEGLERRVSTEVIRLRLRGARASAPASVVASLIVSDLPVFLRWRGRPPFREQQFEQLVGVTNRLIVDSREWADAPGSYGELEEVFERTAISDIAWSRTLQWRRALAGLWPGIAKLSELRVAGPKQEAALLAGWLRARLRREVRLVHDEAGELEALAVDGEPVAVPEDERPTPSELLSRELDNFGRDRIYEEAVRAAASS